LNIPLEAGYLLEKIQKEPTFALKKWFVEILEGLSVKRMKEIIIK
jgi:hypothetical protein